MRERRVDLRQGGTADTHHPVIVNMWVDRIQVQLGHSAFLTHSASTPSSSVFSSSRRDVSFSARS
jgi:hypothetical protein